MIISQKTIDEFTRAYAASMNIEFDSHNDIRVNIEMPLSMFEKLITELMLAPLSLDPCVINNILTYKKNSISSVASMTYDELMNTKL